MTEIAPAPRRPLTAYIVGDPDAMDLIPAPVTRDWMDATPNRFAYRCLPMLIANQAGWYVVLKDGFAATWNGGPAATDLTIEHLHGTHPAYASSHFGSGILTFNVPWLFRTPPGINLHVHGPANIIKDGVAPLEGMVETDWAEATFTMNWKLTRPDHRIVFEAGEPVAMLTPFPRTALEGWVPEIRPVGERPELADGYQAWSKSRSEFNGGRREGWQRHYMRGRTVTDSVAPEHQTGLQMPEFVKA